MKRQFEYFGLPFFVWQIFWVAENQRLKMKILNRWL